jgi:hypothetical protein
MSQTHLELFKFRALILFLAVFFFACSRTPEGIIPEKKMRKVLVDMQLAEVMISMEPQTYRLLADKKALFRSVFDKHQLTEAEYDSSLIWYGKHLDQYLRVYNLATADVKQQIAAIGDVKPEAAPSSNEDSLNIWIFRKYYEFIPRSLSNTVVFDLRPNDAYPSGSAFVLGMQVWGVLPDMRDPIEAHLNAFQGDTTIMAKTVIAHDGYHEIFIKTLPTKKVQRVYGYIRLNTESAAYHKIYVDDLRLMKYRYGSPAIAATDSLAAKRDSLIP